MTKIVTLFATAAVVVSFIPQAHAGFEWKGPVAPPVKAAPAPVMTQDGMSGLEPVNMWNGQNAPAITWSEETAMPAEKVEVVEKTEIHKEVVLEDTPAVEAEAPSMPEVLARASALPPAVEPVADDGEEVAGFGSDLPLVIALQQVVPAGYQFSFASGVNAGALVSWEGGKSWKKVLSDMLATQGLGYKTNGNTVVIGYFKNEEPAQVVPAATAPAAELKNDAEMQPATPANGKPVDIRRKKPSSLFRKKLAPRANEDLSVPPETASSPSTASYTQVPASKGAVEANATAASSVEPAAAEPTAPAHVATGTVATVPLSITASKPAPVSTGANEPTVLAAASAPKALTVIDTPQSAQPESPTWAGAKGQTLRDILKNWSDVAGVELYWSIDYDYRLSEDVGYPGTFDEAVGKLLDRFATVRPQPYGQLHQNGDSPRVLVVKSYDLAK